MLLSEAQVLSAMITIRQIDQIRIENHSYDPSIVQEDPWVERYKEALKIVERDKDLRD